MKFHFQIWFPTRAEVAGELIFERDDGQREMKGVLKMTAAEWSHFAAVLVSAGVQIVQREKTIPAHAIT